VRNACASTVIVTGRVVKLFERGTDAMLEFGALVVVIGVVCDFERSGWLECGTVGAFAWAFE